MTLFLRETGRENRYPLFAGFAILIWREPFKSFEAFGEVIGIQEVVEMLS
jgi:hypothetical protein